MRSLTQTPALLALLAVLASAGQAQQPLRPPSDSKEGADAPVARSAQLLFEETAAYFNRKREEAAKQKVGFEGKLAARATQDQKELAAKYVAELQSRGPVAGDDLYYLGRLQHLAGDDGPALDSLRLFLTMTPEGEKAQLARPIAISCALAKLFLAEAEQIAADYAANQPQQLSQRAEIDDALIGAYRNASDFEMMARHARALLKFVKQEGTGKYCPPCDDLLVRAAGLLAEAYLKQQRPDAAAAVIEGIRKTAVQRPSAGLYLNATRQLAQVAPATDPLRVFQTAAETPKPLPELAASHWIDQTPAKLADLRGRVVLLDFWATWCGPCVSTLPELQKLHTTYKDKGLVVLGVTRLFGGAEGQKMTSEQEIEYLRAFKKQHGLSYGFAVADSDADGTNYGVSGIPTYFLIDRQGHLRQIGVGAASDKSIKDLLAESAPNAGANADAAKQP